MNHISTNNYTKIINQDYHQKVQVLKSIFNQYDIAKQEINQLPMSYQSPLLVKENHVNYGEYEHLLLQRISKINHYQAFIDYIDYKVQYLNETEQLIIKNDFINQKNKKWWEFYFSSATYYRHKKKAVEHLVSLLFS